MGKEFKARLQAFVEQLQPQHRSSTERDLDAILKASVTSTNELIEFLLDERQDTEPRLTACWLLAQLDDDKKLVPVFLSTLQDKVPRIRTSSAQVLGRVYDARAIEPLIATLTEDASAEVRTVAANSLGSMGQFVGHKKAKKAIKALISVLENESEASMVRGEAAEALGNIGHALAVAPLLAALEDTSAEVRFWAVFALGVLGDPQALPALKRLATTDEATLPRWGSIKDEATLAIEDIRSRRTK
jgi:HEAT repeat protein